MPLSTPGRDNMPSWRTAIVFKPVLFGSIYFDSGTSFNPSAEALSLSAANANLPPEKNLTYELGTKWELGKNHVSLRSAVFRTNKYNAREPDPTNSLLSSVGKPASPRVRDAGAGTADQPLGSSFELCQPR